MPYAQLADVVLATHLALVVFVIAGLVLVVLGNRRGWDWVNAWWFRIAHLAVIAIVVAEAWLGFTCPLTTLEQWLREQGGMDSYAGGFIEHWFTRILFFDAPAWVFVFAYTLFGALVLAAWLRYPPNRAPNGPPDSRTLR